MSPPDVLGCAGLAFLIVLILASLPWPRYDTPEWDEHARQETVARLTKQL